MSWGLSLTWNLSQIQIPRKRIRRLTVSRAIRRSIANKAIHLSRCISNKDIRPCRCHHRIIMINPTIRTWFRCSQPSSPSSQVGWNYYSRRIFFKHSLPAATVFIHAAPFSNDPQAMVCPQCRATITTKVKYEPATKTHLFAGLICLMGGWLGCCFIPYCIDSCQAAEHSCKFSLKCC